MLSNERRMAQQERAIKLLKQKLEYFQSKEGKKIKIWLDVELDEVTKMRADVFKEIDNG